MSISPSKARALCTESEYNLVKWSSPKNVKTLTPSKLKDKVSRARKLRDKFRDLAKQQSGEARGKREPTGTRAAKGNERTVQKAELFAQTLDRFQKALEKAEKDAAKPAKSSKKTKKKSTKRQAALSPSEAKPEKTKSPQSKSSTSAASSQTKKPSAKTSHAKSSTSAPAGQSAAKVAPIPLAAPPGRALSGTPSLGGASSKSFTGFFASSAAAQESRETRRRDKSATTKIGREQSRFAATAREKIQGHVSAQTRRSQAKRDSKG